MKKFLLCAVWLIFLINLHGQGTVFFNNFISGTIRAPIYGPEPDDPFVEKHGNTATGIPAGGQIYGGPLLAGTGFTVELWGLGNGGFGMPTPLESDLVKLVSATFRTGTAAGLVNTLSLPNASGIILVPNAPIGGTYGGVKATLQLRAYDNQGGTVTSWIDAFNSPSGVWGKSNVFTPPGDVGGSCFQGCLSPNMMGLTSFNIHQTPEPSSIALLLLGGGLLLLRRRK